MSCQVTYKGKRYDSTQELKHQLLNEYYSDRLRTNHSPDFPLPETAERIISEYDDYIDISEMVRKSSSYDKVTEELRKKVRYFENIIQGLKYEKRMLKEGDSQKNKELEDKINKLEGNLLKAQNQLSKARSIDNIGALSELASDQILDFESILNEIKDMDPINFANRMHFVSKSLSFWKAVGTVSDLDEHILMTPEELAVPEIREKLLLIGAKADNVLAQLRTVMESKLLELVNSRVKGRTVTLDDLRMTTDLGLFNNNLLYDIGVMGDALLALVQLLQKEQMGRVLSSLNETFTDMDEGFDAVLPYFNNDIKQLTEAITQKYQDGTPTNRIVFRFSPEFFEASKAARDEYKRDKSKEAYEKFAQFKRENEILMNPVMLFPTSEGDLYHFGDGKQMRVVYKQSMIDAHIKELKDALGEKDFNLYMKKMRENLDRFAFQYSEQKDYISKLDITEREKERMLHNWEIEHSPYYWAEKVLNNRMLKNSEGTFIRNKGYEYVDSIPRKYRPDGSLTGYYDPQYEFWQSNEQLANFYDMVLHITTSLSEMLSPSQKRELGINGLPFLRKSITEILLQGNVMALSEELYSKFVKEISSERELEFDYEERDPVTGEIIYRTVSQIDTGEQAVKDLVNRKMIAYKLQNPELFKDVPLRKQRKEEAKVYEKFRKEALAELQKERSSDIRTTLRAYAMAANMYRHKVAIEGILNVIADIANDRKAFVTEDGKPKKRKDGTYETSGKANRKIEALKYNLDVFFRNRRYKDEGTVYDPGNPEAGKTYTPKEKERKAQLEALYDENEKKYAAKEISASIYEKNKELLEEQLKNLGGHVVASKVVDQGLRFVTLKGLGYNLLAAFSNVTLGYVANSVEAAKGVHFGNTALSKARRMLNSSVLKNLTFNKIIVGEAKKIRNMLELFDTLKDASNELYKAEKDSTLSGRFKWLNPYQLNKRTEYINQGQTALAYLLHNTVTTKDGRQISLYEAFDENGKWRSDILDPISVEQFGSIKSSVDQLIKRLHGNYDELSPIKGKQTVWGRMLLQFKSWAPESFRRYFGSQTPDYILGDDYKGLFKTAWDTMIVNKGGVRSQTVMESLKEILRNYLNVTSFGAIKSFSKEDAFKFLSESDRANMKGNVFLAILSMNLVALFYALKYMLEDDDEDEILGNITAYFLLHQVSRLQSDLALYTNPAEMHSFFGNMLPSYTILKDLHDVGKATVLHVSGDHYMQSGAFKGWYRINKELGEALPLVSPIVRTYGISQGSSPSLEKTIVDELSE